MSVNLAGDSWLTMEMGMFCGDLVATSMNRMNCMLGRRKLNRTTTRQEEVIEFDNFFKFRFDWDPKYHFELFTLKHPENGDKYLVVYFYIVCPPLLVKAISEET
ncbi:hypothetical protein TYRP_005561 [Tyrophagus putrescentiae]|nr:hypothetical protein TYRP_005561 [Tyrophagus putrescentiae]